MCVKVPTEARKECLKLESQAIMAGLTRSFSSTADAFSHGTVSSALQIVISKPHLLKPHSFFSMKEKEECHIF